jgi:predicted N-acetyltransferase YhbS
MSVVTVRREQADDAAAVRRVNAAAFGRTAEAVLVDALRPRAVCSLVAVADAGVVGHILLGHPTYYPRFGFARADGWGLRCAFDAPAEAFMVLPLRAALLAEYAGATVRYAPEFDRV